MQVCYLKIIAPLASRYMGTGIFSFYFIKYTQYLTVFQIKVTGLYLKEDFSCYVLLSTMALFKNDDDDVK